MIITHQKLHTHTHPNILEFDNNNDEICPRKSFITSKCLKYLSRCLDHVQFTITPGSQLTELILLCVYRPCV